MFLYPWGDMHSLNLGWFLLQFKDWVEKIQEYLDNGGGTSENLANVIAPVFNAANYYSAGDYVLYNNELYKANQAVNPGTWDPSAWDRCLIVDEMGSGGGAGVDNVARLMIAGQYSANFGYQKYAICRYNDKLWMANTDLPSGGEAWNASHWDEITVGAGLTRLRRSVETLAENINGLDAYIRNKRIAIFGDSWSDEDIQWSTTVNDVWVKTFRTLCAPYNATITNYSRSSRGFLRKDNNNQYNGVEAIQNADLTDIDTVIIFMGLNDFLNGIWVGSYSATGSTYLWGALNTIQPLLNGKNVFVITTPQVSSRGTNTVICATLELFRVVLANWCKHCGFMLINGTTCPQLGKGSSAYEGSHIKNAYHPILAQHIFQKIINGGEVFNPVKEILTYVPEELPNNVTTFNGITICYNIDMMEVMVDWVVTNEGSTSGGSLPMPSFSGNSFMQRYLTVNYANHVLRTSYTGSGLNANPPTASLYFAQFDQYATGTDVRAVWANKGWSECLGYPN